MRISSSSSIVIIIIITTLGRKQQLPAFEPNESEGVEEEQIGQHEEQEAAQGAELQDFDD